eukprot:m.64265 g.64265  ORF g.64265 m.64265 type:complete len:239 (+) comp13485_c0_seq1:73-789(+)
MPNVRKSSLYTKAGDQGTSQLYTGQRRSKTDLVFACLGDVDELNSTFGLIRQYLDQRCLQDLDQDLHEIQCLLFELGTHIASPGASNVDFGESTFKLEWLENRIDVLDSELPALQNFILPSGGKAAAHMHVARCICRRAERSLVQLHESDGCSNAAIKFLNRLSDFAFCAARICAYRTKHVEMIFQSDRSGRNVTTRPVETSTIKPWKWAGIAFLGTVAAVAAVGLLAGKPPRAAPSV